MNHVDSLCLFQALFRSILGGNDTTLRGFITLDWALPTPGNECATQILQFVPASGSIHGMCTLRSRYLQHFVYIDSLMYGEQFNYSETATYHLLELSGLPFGMMNDMWY